MSFETYEPEFEEEDSGYSIPKILVAVLLLIVIGAGVYIYLQQKKLTTSVAYLMNAKKQVEMDLNAMIEKYNLAIEDNDFLADELRDERDRIINYRDSIKNIKGEDFGKITKYEQQIRNLKEKSAIVFDDPIVKPANSDIPPVKEEEIVAENVSDKTINEQTDTKNKKSNNTPKAESVKPPKTEQPTVTNVVTRKETPSESITTTDKADEIQPEIVDNNTLKEDVKDNTPKEVVKEKEVEKTTSFIRVETPPTFPGCKGNAAQKKICFTKKVKSFVGKNFNGSIIDELNISSGKKRIWVNFNIDKYGNITNVTAKSPNGLSAKAAKSLEKEATRVVKKLPKMIAARQNGNPVKMVYNVPITIVVP